MGTFTLTCISSDSSSMSLFWPSERQMLSNNTMLYMKMTRLSLFLITLHQMIWEHCFILGAVTSHLHSLCYPPALPFITCEGLILSVAVAWLFINHSPKTNHMVTDSWPGLVRPSLLWREYLFCSLRHCVARILQPIVSAACVCVCT